MRSRRFIGRAGVLAAGVAVLAVLAVAGTLGAGQVRRLNRQAGTVRNLQGLALALARHGAELPGYPFSRSEDAVRALVEAGHFKPEQTLSRTTGRMLVLTPAILAAPTPGRVRSSAGIGPRTIVAHEPLPATDASPACLLFADGHGECVAAGKDKAMLKRLAPNG